MANVEGNADLDSPICLVIAYKKKKARGILNQSCNATIQTQLQIDSENFSALRPVSHMIFEISLPHIAVCLFVLLFP